MSALRDRVIVALHRIAANERRRVCGQMIRTRATTMQPGVADKRRTLSVAGSDPHRSDPDRHTTDSPEGCGEDRRTTARRFRDVLTSRRATTMLVVHAAGPASAVGRARTALSDARAEVVGVELIDGRVRMRQPLARACVSISYDQLMTEPGIIEVIAVEPLPVDARGSRRRDRPLERRHRRRSPALV